jgi:hypothetical protein
LKQKIRAVLKRGMSVQLPPVAKKSVAW